MANDNFERLNPDVLLEVTNKMEEKNQKGKLTIFFGMAAGVGKTYQMLLDAHALVKEGIDVVVGYVETHNRIEIENLLQDLEIIPRRKHPPRDILLEEMDIDTILERHPAIVLIDELAHTNIPDSRHKKRYQDVMEILDNGINVYTTVNVQHIESYSSTVEQITDVKIRETIPDSILEIADKIKLIDITPEELQKRLQEGKVYLPDKASSVSKNFFREGNLTALREMALQFTAKKVAYDLSSYMQTKNIKETWKSTERLLVAIGTSPYAEYLIKWTKRMAFNLEAPWIATYVEKQETISEKEQICLNRNINLAKELGAEVITTADEDVARGLIRIAKQKNATQIIIGKPLRKNIKDIFTGGNITDKLIKESGDIDVHVVSEPGVSARKKKSTLSTIDITSKPNDYLIVCLIICFVTAINFLLSKLIGYWSVGIVFLATVAIIAGLFGKGPTLLAAFTSALLWNFLFIPPLFTLHIAKIEDIFMFIMYFLVAVITGNLTSRLHIKELVLLKREKKLSDLYDMTTILNTAVDIDEIIDKSTIHLEHTFDAKVGFILIDEKRRLKTELHKRSSFSISEKEFAIAHWTYENKKPAGRFTDTLSGTEIYYLPLSSHGRVVGVLAIRFSKEYKLTSEQEDLLQILSYQISMAIERELLSEINQRARVAKEVATESEKIYNILLNSISHELRTPITSISIAVSGLTDDVMSANEEAHKILCEDIQQAAQRLNRIVDNLLGMIKLESGKLKLNLQWYEINELVNSVLSKLQRDILSHEFEKEISSELPMIKVDFILMEQVISNLVYNAIIHTSPKSKITLKIFEKDKSIYIVVKDDGPGLDKESLSKVFEKFYRRKTSTGGVGLGLSICKSIVEIHGGTINAANNDNGIGVSFIVKLPKRN